MNQFAADTIVADGKKGRSGGKYVVLAGKAHSNTKPLRKNNVGFDSSIPGLSQLLDIPALHVTAGQHHPEIDHENKNDRYG